MNLVRGVDKKKTVEKLRNYVLRNIIKTTTEWNLYKLYEGLYAIIVLIESIMKPRPCILNTINGEIKIVDEMEDKRSYAINYHLTL